MLITSYEINKKFANTIKEEIYGIKKHWYKDLNNVKALTSGFEPSYLFFDIIKKQLTSQLFKITNTPLKPSCWWANFYEPGHYTKLHHHNPEIISSITIIKADKSNPLYFDLKPGILQVQEYDGLVIFFDSKLHHGVNVCKGERITLAVDFVKSLEYNKNNLD
tara:strand:- start:361 stop:849 length:489 start_codon:yes stop_codon:yes gene_type:complete